MTVQLKSINDGYVWACNVFAKNCTNSYNIAYCTARENPTVDVQKVIMF